MDEQPLPRRGVLRWGVAYRYSVPAEPKREPKPEVLEVIRRARRKRIREYLERRKRAS